CSPAIGRTSMVPYQALGCLDAIAMASSRSEQSITSYPPTCSLVSAKGPSLTSSSRSRIRTEVASLTSLSRWPCSSTPRPSISRNQSAYAGSPAGRGVAPRGLVDALDQHVPHETASFVHHLSDEQTGA